jgi:hypothetical protein
MAIALRGIVTLILLASIATVQSVDAQGQDSEVRPTVASGTLNLVLMNKNGFVIAADSRMSSSMPFPCAVTGKSQTYCDNSQKLFRTGPNSAMVIAGFAVGAHNNSPLDLVVASMFRREFGSAGLPGEMGMPGAASDWAEHALTQALIGIASLFKPSDLPASALSLTTTFAGIGKDGAPIVKQLVFTETWHPAGPLSVMAPEYQVRPAEAKVTKFLPVTAGITCVADAILSGIYKSDDPIIQSYKQKLSTRLLDDLSLQEMDALAKSILRETRKFTSLVGGENQIAIFPATGHVRWHLPQVLPSATQLSPSFMLWKGLLCLDQQPQCHGHLSYFQDFQHPIEETIPTFFLASQFKNISVALDNNFFVDNSFEKITFQWQGGTLPFMQGNTFFQCVVELPEGRELPPNSELSHCALVKKREVVVDASTVGAPSKMQTSGCQTKNPDGTMTFTAGGGCGNDAGFIGPLIKP